MKNFVFAIRIYTIVITVYFLGMTVFGYLYPNMISFGSLMNEIGSTSMIFLFLALLLLAILYMISKTSTVFFRQQRKSIKFAMILQCLLIIHFIIRCFIHDDEPIIGTGFTSSKWMATMAEGLALHFGVFLIFNNISQIGKTSFRREREIQDKLPSELTTQHETKSINNTPQDNMNRPFRLVTDFKLSSKKCSSEFMPRRVTFVGSWVVLILGIIVILFPIFVIILSLLDIFSLNPSNGIWVVIVLATFIEIFVIIFLGFKAVQWVVIDESGISARCLWKVIKKIKWSGVNDIRQVYIPINLLFDLHLRWICFDDGCPTIQQNYFELGRNTPIMIKDNEKSHNILQRFLSQSPPTNNLSSHD